VIDSSTDMRIDSSLEGLAISGSVSSATPEPASLLLLLSGFLLLTLYLRKCSASN